MKKIFDTLGYAFKDKSLLQCALTHRSKQKLENNERLEFLGDAVLSLIISTELLHRHPQFTEGELSRLRAALVKGETIAKLAVTLNIPEFLNLSFGENHSGGRLRESILSGAFEAIIGAIYCDSDFKTTQQCVLKWYGDLITDIDTYTDVKDAKTQLQEWLQAKKMPLPTYACKILGKAHEQTFVVTCKVTGMPMQTEGKSTSRRKAEQIAAKYFLEKLSTV